MNKLIVILSLLLSQMSVASQGSECPDDYKNLSANYEITETDTQGVTKSIYLNLWRKGNQLAHQHPQRKVTEHWSLLSNNKITTAHYFDSHQRGIEYQPGELLGKQKNWQSKYQIVPDSLINKMQLIQRAGQDCQQTETYQLQEGDMKYNLVWLPQRHLLQSYSLQSAETTISWTLTNINADINKITAFFRQRDQYQMTDYADIGDNESDPFLLSMINLGF